MCSLMWIVGGEARKDAGEARMGAGAYFLCVIFRQLAA